MQPIRVNFGSGSTSRRAGDINPVRVLSAPRFLPQVVGLSVVLKIYMFDESLAEVFKSSTVSYQDILSVIWAAYRSKQSINHMTPQDLTEQYVFKYLLLAESILVAENVGMEAYYVPTTVKPQTLLLAASIGPHIIRDRDDTCYDVRGITLPDGVNGININYVQKNAQNVSVSEIHFGCMTRKPAITSKENPPLIDILDFFSRYMVPDRMEQAKALSDDVGNPKDDDSDSKKLSMWGMMMQKLKN